MAALSDDQVVAIVRATGKLPPGYHLPPVTQLSVPPPKPFEWAPQETGKQPEEKRPRGRPRKQVVPPPANVPFLIDQRRVDHRDAIEREVEAYLKERLDEFVGLMQWHYVQEEIDGRLTLRPRCLDIDFDGFYLHQRWMVPGWYPPRNGPAHAPTPLPQLHRCNAYCSYDTST